MQNIYCTSDIHAHFYKFQEQLPKIFDKVIFVGDLFNKGFENELMLKFLIKNAGNPQYSFILGNHEVRTISELKHHYKINDELFNDCFRVRIPKKNRDLNEYIYSAQMIIAFIERGIFSLKEIIKMFNNFRWYEDIKIDGGNRWIISHASWAPFEKNTNAIIIKKNMVYDTINLIQKLKNNTEPVIQKYVKYCQENNVYHVFGHYPTNQTFGEQPPVSLHKRFFYIDPGVLRTNNLFFFKLF